MHFCRKNVLKILIRYVCFPIGNVHKTDRLYIRQNGFWVVDHLIKRIIVHPNCIESKIFTCFKKPISQSGPEFIPVVNTADAQHFCYLRALIILHKKAQMQVVNTKTQKSIPKDIPENRMGRETRILHIFNSPIYT